MSSSPLLINEHPLMVLPSLATEIGLNQAIVLQQVHYWLDLNRKAKKDSHFRDGNWWTYNTFEAWQESNFPFWSVRTLKRVFKTLEDKGLLIARKFNRDDWNHTKWYTIDYEALNTLALSIVPSCHDQSCQVGTMQGDNVAPSSISTETNNQILTSTTRAKPRKKGGGSESVSLLDSEGSTAKDIAEWLCAEYWYHQMGSADPLRFNCTSYLVDACKGHTKETARAAMLAFWEAMLGYVDIGQSINKPERFLAMRLKDREPMSSGNRGKVEEYERAVRERMRRASAIDYNLRWLSHAESADLIYGLQIDEEYQFYHFFYSDTGEQKNLNLWVLPPRYDHLTIDQLMKVAA